MPRGHCPTQALRYRVVNMGVPTEPALRGRPRDPRRREAILSAAVALVAEVGYDRMTVEALAARAGVSKPTIYRRWPGGKKEIVLDAIRSKHAGFDSIPDAGSLRGDLLALLGAMIEHIDEDAHLAGGLISQLRDSEELAALMRDEVVDHRATALRRPDPACRGARRALRRRPHHATVLRRRRCGRLHPRGHHRAAARPSISRGARRPRAPSRVEPPPQGSLNLHVVCKRVRRIRPSERRTGSPADDDRRRGRARRDHVDPRHDRRQRRHQHAGA